MNEEEETVLYGLANQQGFPRLESEYESYVNAIRTGWVLKRRVHQFNVAMAWFISERDQFYREQDIRAQIIRNPRVACNPEVHVARERVTRDKIVDTGLENLAEDIEVTAPPQFPSVGRNEPSGQGNPLREESPVEGYIGLEKREPWLRVCVRDSSGLGRIQEYIDKGYSWVIRLPDCDSALSWAKVVEGRTSVNLPCIQRGMTNTGFLPSGYDVSTNQVPETPSPMRMRESGERNPIGGGSIVEGHAARTQVPAMFMIGTDPSAGDDTNIFRMDIINQVEID